MEIQIEVNNKLISAVQGETILTALKRNGIKVPTICNMKDFSPTGACRMCVVEVEGKERLIPSCSHPIEEWMKIKTHSPRVISARKTIIELLLADHPDDCLYCERNGNCELQVMAEDFNIRERKLSGKKKSFQLDKSCPGITRDPAKCILCGRCVRVCEEKQQIATFDFAYRGIKTQIATTFKSPLSQSNCINCGQCVVYCPTGALTENQSLTELENLLYHPDKKYVIQYSTAIATSINEEFGLKSGKYSGGYLNAAFRKIGFDHVIDTTLGADIVTEELTDLLIKKIKTKNQKPVFSSCCPAWVLYVEKSYPELIQQLSGIKSPQVLSSIIQKKHIANKHNLKPEDVFTVSVMPCIAKKFESKRPELIEDGIPAVDMVITTRELFRLIKMNGIDVENIEPETISSPFDKSSGGAKIINISGGTTEALIRTFYHRITKKEFSEKKIQVLRSSKNLKEYSLSIDDNIYGFAVINGFDNIEENLEKVKNRKDLLFIEVMTCPGGCVAGGGQKKITGSDQLKQRSKPLYDMDDRAIIKASFKNPNLNYINNDILDKNKKVKTTSYSEKKSLPDFPMHE